MRHTTRLLKKHTLNLAARKQHALNQRSPAEGRGKGQQQVFAPYALNQRSPAEGKGKGQQLLAQGSALGNHRRTPLAL